MNDEYISRLIYLLDNHTSERELTDALSEMAENPSEIFMYPLLATYRKFQNASISHYFISALGSINTPRAITILKGIFDNEKTKRIDKLWTLPYFEKNNQFEEKYIDFCTEQLLKLERTGVMEDEYYDEFELPGILSFLKATKKLKDKLEVLESILLDPSQRRALRKIILFYWLREEPDNRLKFLLEKYIETRDDDFDIILAEELIRWRGSKVSSLITLIKEKGYPRAKEILEKNEEKKQITNIQRREDRYPNIDQIKEISDLRSRVNFLSQKDNNLGFKIFVETERLVKQQESINNKDNLVAACIDLRDIIQNITVEAASHNMDLEEAKKYIPSITVTDLKKRLNAFHLNLISKGITVPQDLYGFKLLNRALSLIAAHPTESKDLIKSLTYLDLIDLYNNSNWQEMHSILLKKYKESLEKLIEALEKTSN